MSEERAKTPATKEFLAERDHAVYQLAAAGQSYSAIATRFGISRRAVSAAVRRVLDRMNQEAFLNYPQVLRMELERIDALWRAVFPMTQHRKVVMDDGTTVDVLPDLRAVQEARNLIAQRTKLLGMEVQRVEVQQTADIEVRSSLVGDEVQTARVDKRGESLAIAELMWKSGQIDRETYLHLSAGESETDQDGDIVEADIVKDHSEESNPRELPAPTNTESINPTESGQADD